MRFFGKMNWIPQETARLPVQYVKTRPQGQWTIGATTNVLRH